MLILSRKEGEGFTLGDDIVIKIVSTSKGVVKLGIDAPKNVLILRSELIQAIKDKNLESSSELNEEELAKITDKIKKHK